MDIDNFCTPINQLGSDSPPIHKQPQVDSENNKEPLQVQNYSDILKSITTPEQKAMSSINQIQEIQQQNVQQAPISNNNAQLQQQYAYQQQPQQQQSQPQYQQQPQSQYQQHVDTKHIKKSVLKNNFYCDNDFQNESLSLLAVYVLMNSEFFQNFLKSKFPSIIAADTGKTNIVGIIIQGIVLIIGFNFTKKVILKYIKDA